MDPGRPICEKLPTLGGRKADACPERRLVVLAPGLPGDPLQGLPVEVDLPVEARAGLVPAALGGRQRVVGGSFGTVRGSLGTVTTTWRRIIADWQGNATRRSRR